MEMNKSSSLFSMGKSAQERGLSYVPECYKIPSSDHTCLNPETGAVPVIDLGKLRQGEEERAMLIKEIRTACSQFGIFQIVNHGISQSILDEVLATAFDFFKLPAEEKDKFTSNDVHKPVRYGTSLKDGVDEIQFWRVFLKHYAYPLDQWIDSWPESPPDYREKMGKYCAEVRKLSLEIMGAITESLGLGLNYLGNKIEEGMQVTTVNCYPPCPNPETALGLPPHSDYTCITMLLQSSSGLQILDIRDGSWKLVPELQGTLQVQIGDHFEVLSNGMYKSVLHRATLNNQRTRISIASLHSLGLDDKMGTAPELVDDQNPKRYKESSFKDFLDFLTKNDISKGESFIDTLKI